ncbi:MAG: hypothetical protein ACAH82_00455 [Solirubrobacteraceae bacterium]
MSDLLGGPGRVPTGLIVAGWIFAFLLPIVGLVIGVIALAKGVTIQAVGIIVVSLIVGAVSFAAIF